MPLRRLPLAVLRCPSDDKTGLQTGEGIVAWASLRIGPVAVTSYAGSIGSQIMESFAGCNMRASNIVPAGGGRYDLDNDGEDWFNTTSTMRPPCNGAGKGNIRSDCAVPKHISGVFARSNWAASMREIEDGTSNTIAMGEVRPSSSGFQWINGWTRSEGLWFATTSPINYLTDPEEVKASGMPPRCRNWEDDFNVAMGFKSRHAGGANFALCDGSVHFLQESIDYTTYQRLAPATTQKASKSKTDLILHMTNCGPRIRLFRLALVTVAGCESTAEGPQTYAVTGEVTLNGQMVAGADVAFLPSAGTPDAVPAQAVTDETGRFEVVTLFDQGRTSQAGMTAGTYGVQITQLKRPPPSAGLSQPPSNMLPQKYASPETSGLTATVIPDGENHFVFELRTSN